MIQTSNQRHMVPLTFGSITLLTFQEERKKIQKFSDRDRLVIRMKAGIAVNFNKRGYLYGKADFITYKHVLCIFNWIARA